MPTAAVLMSTYNGEKYLREQIQSILSQEEVEVSLFIRDDGSSDSTRSLLIEFASRFPSIHVFHAQNVGVGNSFYQLLYQVPDSYDYYAFADQDDIWKPDKLAAAIRKLEETGASLYASNQECIDAAGNRIALRYEPDRVMHLDPVSIVLKNNLAGCTMVFPNAFFKTLTAPDHRPSADILKIRIHDVWTALAASLADGICYDNQSHIEYRQHERNVVGAYEKHDILTEVQKKIRKLREKNNRNGRSRLAREAVEKFGMSLQENGLLTACAYADTFENKVTITRNMDMIRSMTGETPIGLLLKIWLGLF